MTWRRPTLPCLEAQYHGRWGFSRPSSGWDRVGDPRHDHQVVQSTLGASVREGEVRFWSSGEVCYVRYPGDVPGDDFQDVFAGKTSRSSD
jgi:hypothetical protein